MNIFFFCHSLTVTLLTLIACSQQEDRLSQVTSNFRNSVMFPSLLKILRLVAAWNIRFWFFFHVHHILGHLKVVQRKSESHSVVSNPLWLHGLYSSWDSPGQNTRMGSLSLFQGILPIRDQTQVSSIAGRFFTSWATGKVTLYLDYMCAHVRQLNMTFKEYLTLPPIHSNGKK